MHIRTVVGNIAPEELGITLGHEHLLIDLRGLWDNPPIERAFLIDQKPTLENLGELMRNPYDSRPNLLVDDPELSIHELLYYKQAGGQGIIDMTTVGIKPDPQGLFEIAQRTGVHVVAGCGYYRQPLVPVTLHKPRDIDRIECVLRLLEKGYGSQIMLAHDICTLIQFHQYGGWGWDHLLSNIAPRLRHAGVSQQELDVMFIETPRRLLTFSE